MKPIAARTQPTGYGRCAVPASSEVIAHSTERAEKALRLLSRLEPPHDALSLPRRLV